MQWIQPHVVLHSRVSCRCRGRQAGQKGSSTAGVSFGPHCWQRGLLAWSDNTACWPYMTHVCFIALQHCLQLEEARWLQAVLPCQHAL